ncbi:MAG: ribonuclease J, partial [Rhodospirillaceae bacterium]|nr:ribonuclease J [Rhodospirillaceae bacterium]
MARKTPELVFLPLGGAGEIGMNLSLYGYGDDWLIVDCGITFGDERTPGIDVMVPDISFITDLPEKPLGIVLTHAHEDHLGAVPYLWREIGCPVYATPFASGLLRRKLPEAGLEGKVPIREVPCGGGIEIGPFDLQFVSLAHSVPETQAIAITTPAGTILHATDWKLDSAPLLGPVTDEAALKQIGDDGVIAMMCDSTNVFVDGSSGSEGPLRESLIEIVGNCKGRVAIACFASNVARMETCVAAAQATGRHVGLVGRSLWRMNEVARECGYLMDCPEFVNVDEIDFLPREEVLLIVTGSQGEAQAALSRIASGDHRDVSLEAGDTVIFSSKEIPGNEKAIGRIQNRLAAEGIKIITEDKEFVHVSGHPARDELKSFYEWVRPPLLVPIHGETRHLKEHLSFARECGIPEAVMAENGSMLRLAPGPVEIVDEVFSGRMAIDGKRLIPVNGDVIRARRRIGYSGIAVATIVFNKKGDLHEDPQLSLPGLADGTGEDEDIHNTAIAAIADAVEDLSHRARDDD